MSTPVEVFTVRLWKEKLDIGQSEWRGKIHHLPSGNYCYFKEVGKIDDFISDQLVKGGEEPEPVKKAGVFHPSHSFKRYPFMYLSKRKRFLSHIPRKVENPSFNKSSNDVYIAARANLKKGVLHSLATWVSKKLSGKGKDKVIALGASTLILAATLVILSNSPQDALLNFRAGSVVFRPESLLFGFAGFPQGVKLTGKKARKWFNSWKTDVNR